MQTEQVTTFTAFRFAGFANRFWAFTQMGLAPARLRNIAGLQFNKLVGSGAANGFSIRPNFGLYGMLQVWESEQFSLDFLAKHPVYHDYKQHSAEIQKTRALGWYKGELFARFVPTAAKAPASGMLGKMPD